MRTGMGSKIVGKMFSRNPVPASSAGIAEKAKSWAPQYYDQNSTQYFGGFTGSKYTQGMGGLLSTLESANLPEMRRNSRRLFKISPYGRGPLRRAITMEVGVGISMEMDPIWLALESLTNKDYTSENKKELTDLVEAYFEVWRTDPLQCDHQLEHNFSQQQGEIVRLNSVVDGDILCISRQSKTSKMNRMQYVRADYIKTPPKSRIPQNHKVIDGVEINAAGRHMAYWVFEPPLNAKVSRTRWRRIPASAAKGRRTAWMVYGTELLHGETRGEPLLGVILQKVKDLDHYSDATLQAADIRASLSFFIEKDREPLLDSIKQNSNTVNPLEDEEDLTSTDTMSKRRINGMDTGSVWDLQAGESIKTFIGDGPETSFGDYEKAALALIGFALEFPPEILLQTFDSNYSASQQARIQYGMYLDKFWARFSDQFNRRVYREWLISSALNFDFDLPGFLSAFLTNNLRIMSAWLRTSWRGKPMPSLDPLKDVKAIEKKIEIGMMSRTDAARLDGRDYRRVMAEQKEEAVLMAEANAPLSESTESDGGGGDNG